MQARRLPARHGFLWLIASFQIFRSNPMLITVLSLGYMSLILVLKKLEPLGPFLLTFAFPTLVVILSNGCRAVQRGGGIGTVALIHGIKSHRITLLQLGGLLLVCAMAIVAVMLAVSGQSLRTSGEAVPMDDEEVVRFMLQLLVVSLPAIAAFWFAPLLAAWEGISSVKSVFFSFVAVWRNWRAFLAYLLSVSVISFFIPSAILIGAGAISSDFASVVSKIIEVLFLFVLWPVTTTTVFVSYQDVFHGEPVGD